MATNKETFDRIAESWYGFRHWPLLGEELSEVAVRWQGGRLLNLGCAHGPDFLPFVDGFELYGVDFSARMLTMARQYMKRHGFHAEVVQADLTALPFDQGSFDYAVSIAALHHIDEQSARLGAFRELNRVLRPSGEAYLSVWNHLQPSFRSGPQDRMVPWRCGNVTLYRTYHLFTPAELISCLTETGFEVLWLGCEGRHSGPAESGRNVCALAIKVDN